MSSLPATKRTSMNRGLTIFKGKFRKVRYCFSILHGDMTRHRHLNIAKIVDETAYERAICELTKILFPAYNRCQQQYITLPNHEHHHR